MRKCFLPLEKVPLTEKLYNERGKFRIILPEVFGFCGGVINALKKMESVLRKHAGKNIYLPGEIIHNSDVNDFLKSRGVTIIQNNNLYKVIDLAGTEDVIIIPAFGIPFHLEQQIKANFKHVIDTTCRYVKHVWDFIKSESEKKATIIIYGQPGHQEVQAGISRASKDCCVLVIPDLQTLKTFAGTTRDNYIKNERVDIGVLPNLDNIYIYNGSNFNINRFALASQTTMLYNEVISAGDILSELAAFTGIEFVYCNTICKATYNRQAAALDLLRKQPDIVFVLGGYDSSNTNHLFKLASRQVKTYYVKNASYLTEAHVKHYLPAEDKEISVATGDVFHNVKTVGILAGASCPFYIVKNVIHKLVEFKI